MENENLFIRVLKMLFIAAFLLITVVCMYYKIHAPNTNQVMEGGSI